MTRNRSAEERARATVERIKTEKAAEEQRLQDRISELKRAAASTHNPSGVA